VGAVWASAGIKPFLPPRMTSKKRQVRNEDVLFTN
jgi:hypothetical protein